MSDEKEPDAKAAKQKQAALFLERVTSKLDTKVLLETALKQAQSAATVVQEKVTESYDDGSLREGASQTVSVVAGGGRAVVATKVAVGATATVSHVAGGAAIMKTLAIAGGIVGGGAGAGIAVVGFGAAALGYGAYKAVRIATQKKDT